MAHISTGRREARTRDERALLANHATWRISVSDLNKSRDEAIAEAKANGLEVIYTEPNKLLIDLDDEDAQARFQNMIDMLDDVYGFIHVETWQSKSRKPEKQHVVITMSRELSLPERIALQAIMGSDPRRELLSLARHEDVDNPVVLFKPKPLMIAEVSSAIAN